MDSPRICAVVTAGSTAEAINAIEGVSKLGLDLIEVRFDYMARPREPGRIRKATDLTLIATNRRSNQGGRTDQTELQRIGLLTEAAEVGFDYVDVELLTDYVGNVLEKIRAHDAKIVVSYHNFDRTPSADELSSILGSERSLGADVCKIVGTAQTPGDSLAYLRLIEENPEDRLVCFGMGAPGITSRVLSSLFGAAWTYASTGAGLESAPGQPTMADLRKIYAILEAMA